MIKLSKAKIYKIEKYSNSNDNAKSFIVELVVYAVILIIVDALFRNIYIENFLYALIAAFILSFLNSKVKPLLIILTLPLTIITCGIAYPIVNVIILKLCDWLMGSAFEMGGLISSFIIAIFISLLKMMFDRYIQKRVK